MAVQKVLMLGNPMLRESSLSINEFDSQYKQILRDLKDTLKHLQKTKKIGRALSAPQIGHLQKVIYYNLPTKAFAMVNPEIIQKSLELIHVWDTCYSFDAAFFVGIERYKSIKVKYQDENGKEKIEHFSESLSELVQHEVDHLNGILATDYLKDTSEIIMRDEWEKIRMDRLYV